LELDRKVLAAIAFDDAAAFGEIVQAVKEVKGAAAAA
jgi:ribosomal protein L20